MTLALSSKSADRHQVRLALTNSSTFNSSEDQDWPHSRSIDKKTRDDEEQLWPTHVIHGEQTLAQKEHKTKAGKAFFIFSVTSLVCNVVMAIFYVCIAGMGIMIAHHDSLQDITLYTQAISDWTQPGWIDF